MRLIPPVSLKLVNDCEQGELILLKKNDQLQYCIVTQARTPEGMTKQIIYLPGPHSKDQCVYRSAMGMSNENCISLGTSYKFEIDICKEALELTSKKEQLSGSIVFTKEGNFLIAEHENGESNGFIYFSLESGQGEIYHYPDKIGWRLTSWSLSLEAAPKDQRVLLSMVGGGPSRMP